MIAKTEAITLRIAPFSNTSHMVTWLTPHHGKILTVVKGACRPKGAFLGQYDIGYRCELLYYMREFRGTHVIRECSPLATRRGIRKHWDAVFILSYLCHLANVISVAGPHQAEAYRALDDALDLLDSTSIAPLLALLWVELKLAESAGFSPQLTQCIACRKKSTEGERFNFSIPRGGIVCPSCILGEESGLLLMPPDVLALLRRWLAIDRPERVARIHGSAKQIHSASKLLGTFLSYHLDLAPECRDIAVRMALSADATQQER